MPRRIAAATATVAALLAFAASAQARPLLGFNDTFATPADVALSTQNGATTDRMFVRWDLVEGTRGRYRWNIPDAQYKTMLAAGVTPMWAIIGAPAWARGSDCTKFVTCPQGPAYDADFDRFVTALAKRYQQSAAIEIGNEVNLANMWETPDPARYTTILKGAYSAIKAVEPQIQVLVGGICPGGASGKTIRAGDFLAGIYANGGKGYFDGIGWHVYVGGPPSTVAPDIKSEMNQGRQVRDANSDAVPFWITETGFTSQGRSLSGLTTYSEATQAASVATDYRVLASMPDVHAVYFFRVFDSNQLGDFVAPGTQTSTAQTMGFYRVDRSPKPAVKALRDALNAPAWPSYQLHLGALSPTIRSGQNFQLGVTGYDDSAPVKYQWLIWHTDHWSLPHVTTASPNTPFHIYRPGRYSLAVRMVTSADTYLSNPIDVTVLPQSQAAPKHRAKARKKQRKHAKRKTHSRRHARR